MIRTPSSDASDALHGCKPRAIHLLRTALAFLLFARAVDIHSDERCYVFPVARTDEADK